MVEGDVLREGRNFGTLLPKYPMLLFCSAVPELYPLLHNSNCKHSAFLRSVCHSSKLPSFQIDGWPDRGSGIPANLQ